MPLSHPKRHRGVAVSTQQLPLCCSFLLTLFFCSSVCPLHGINQLFRINPLQHRFSIGCREYLLCHGAPPLLLRPWYFPVLFLTLFILSFSLSGIFCPFLNTLSQRHHQCGWGAQLCPVMGPLKLAGHSCGQHGAGPGLFSQRPALVKTLPWTPSTNVHYHIS